jgi:hypothetical protein
VHFVVAKLYVDTADGLRKARKHLRTARRLKPDVPEYSSLLADVELKIKTLNPPGTDRCVESDDEEAREDKGDKRPTREERRRLAAEEQGRRGDAAKEEIEIVARR